MDSKATEALIQLSSKLGVAVEHLWGVLVKQSQVDALISGIWLALSLIAFVYSLYSTVKFYKRDWKVDEKSLISFVVSFIVLAFSFLCVLGNFHDFVRAYVNPEYQALLKLRDIIK